MKDFLIIAVLILILSYFLLWVIMFIAWQYSFQSELRGGEPTPVSCIVCVWNEEVHLPRFLEGMSKWLLIHPDNEIVFVLDGCTDTSEAIVRNWSEQSGEEQIKIIKNSVNMGKKMCIMQASSVARNEWIWLRDADTYSSSDLVAQQPYLDSDSDLVAGAVLIHFQKGFLSYFQYLESRVMNVFTAGFMAIKCPALMSAANLYVRKEILLKEKPYENNLYIRSGDDMFLLDYALKTNKNIIFTHIRPVYTYPEKSVKDFILQRIRWGGKSIYLHNPYNKILALILLLVNSWVIFLLFIENSRFAGLYFYFLKCLIDILFLFLTLKMSKEKINLFFILASAFIYPVYFSITSLISPYYVFKRR
ncbi:MAG: glycosyltransferase [Bacteroidia bacterium]|nr:glycosyltransferase [Bacteroidia bacterium]